jgi:riboflavin kinase/FMN adenylyltransferase
MNEILISLFKVSYMVFGYDNHFGKNREGTFKFISENFKNINADLIIASKKDEITISSTRIKEEIVNGHIINANKLLGHPYIINGKVVKGMQLGRKLGFPTANLACNNNDKILPKNGVYYTLTKIKEKEYVSITNIGIKPSVQKSNSISIETYIIDFNQSIYGRNISIKFIDRIRDEIKFNNISDLINQITLDVSHVRKLNSLQITT